MKKLWGGRFEGGTHAGVEAFTESVSYDQRLAPWDIRGSVAHARMLGEQGVIPKQDAAKIIQGLEGIAADIREGRFTFDPALEDVHMNIEAALTERIGEAGKKLHTARSRNDQIALDVRMWMRDQIDAIVALLKDYQLALIELAERNVDVILPGCTHLQHAQPVLLAHHLLAYVEMHRRDVERYAQLRGRANVLPLGSAALAGTPYPIDRDQVARELGFDAVSANSMDAVADRDHVIEFCAAGALAMTHLSRFCEELILWMTPEFGFIAIGDDYATGSSIMPQKKNPDVAELIRGKTARVHGNLTALLTLMKALPLAYNRDLQEDKEPLFDTSDTVQQCLRVAAGMAPSIQAQGERMAEAAREGFLEATDVADYLAGKGMPFRQAHEVAGKLVLACAKRGVRLPELTPGEYREANPLFGDDIVEYLTLERVVARRDNEGGTAPRRVKAALRRARQQASKS
jgi:argininosuccinate lyase